jgi:hypothetical protein
MEGDQPTSGAASDTGQPNLVLAMISVLLAATIVFVLRGIFG